MFSLNSVLFSNAAAAETPTDKTEINNVNLHDELKQHDADMEETIPKRGENARELEISVGANPRELNENSQALNIPALREGEGHDVLCSGSVSSYTDSLEIDELSQTGSDVTGTESEKCTKKRRSRLPVKTQSSVGLGSRVTSYAEQNGSLHRQSLPENSYETGGIGRSHSVSELFSGQYRVAKETITSRMRFDKHHGDHDHLGTSEEYLTPLQRKEQTIRNLRKRIKELVDTEKQLEQTKEVTGREEQTVLKAKDAEIKRLNESLVATLAKCEELTKSYEESVKTINTLEETLTDFRESISKERAKHEQMYLEMYRKGQESARFERDEELEMLATNSKQNRVSVKEVVRKLSRTQSELARWQSLRRQEIYAEADKPETEADTTLRFLKDSFFHFLTDGKDSDDHLRAIVRIFHYSDIQKKKMEQAQRARKNSKH